MNKKNPKKLLSDIRKLNIKVSLSSDKSFVIYDPSVPPEYVQDTIDMVDELCILLENEERLLSNEDAELIESITDDAEDIKHSIFKLTDPSNVAKESRPVIEYDKITPESFNEDFDFIRKNLKDIIINGTDALNRMILVAEASMHPRAYEVVATLMKSLADINKDLLESHKKKLEVNLMSVAPATSNQINNTQNNNIVFTGSTSELAKLLKNSSSK